MRVSRFGVETFDWGLNAANWSIPTSSIMMNSMFAVPGAAPTGSTVGSLRAAWRSFVPGGPVAVWAKEMENTEWHRMASNRHKVADFWQLEIFMAFLRFENSSHVL